jgi:hypothetical protein
MSSFPQPILSPSPVNRPAQRKAAKIVAIVAVLLLAIFITAVAGVWYLAKRSGRFSGSGEKKYAGLVFQVPAGWTAFDEGSSLMIWDLSSALSGQGSSQTATINMRALPYVYNTQKHRDSIARAIQNGPMTVRYQGLRTLDVAGYACDCSEFTKNTTIWLSACAINGQRGLIVFAGDKGRVEEFYRWLATFRIDAAAQPSKPSM